MHASECQLLSFSAAFPQLLTRVDCRFHSLALFELFDTALRTLLAHGPARAFAEPHSVQDAVASGRHRSHGHGHNGGLGGFRAGNKSRSRGTRGGIHRGEDATGCAVKSHYGYEQYQRYDDHFASDVNECEESRRADSAAGISQRSEDSRKTAKGATVQRDSCGENVWGDEGLRGMFQNGTFGALECPARWGMSPRAPSGRELMGRYGDPGRCPGLVTLGAFSPGLLSRPSPVTSHPPSFG